MAMRRKTPTNMQDVKRSRASYKGHLSKLEDKLGPLKAATLGECPLHEVERLKVQIMDLCSKYLSTLEEAVQFIPEGDGYLEAVDQEEALMDLFESNANELIRIATNIIKRHQIHSDLRDLTNKYRFVRAKTSADPSFRLTSSIDKLEEQRDKIYLKWQEAFLPEPDILLDELERLQGLISELRIETAISSPMMSGSLISGSLSTSIRDDRDTGKGKLPYRALPTFHGDIMLWSTFWADFTAAVEGRGLSPYTKLSYLRDCVKDPATKKVLITTKETEDSYQKIVNILQERFDRPKEVHRLFVKQLLQAGPIKHSREHLWEAADDQQLILEGLEGTKGLTGEQIMTSLLFLRLPLKMQQHWEQQASSTTGVTNIQDFLKFVRKYAQTLQPVSTLTPSTPQPTSEKRFQKKPNKAQEQQSSKQRNAVHLVAKKPPYNRECLLCPPEKHPLHSCPKWLGYSVSTRMEQVQTLNLCSNCLAVGHQTADCRSHYSCRDCSARHHTTLHAPAANQVHTYSNKSQEVPDALLMTAQVLLWGPGGMSIPGRALLDTAAGISLVTSRKAQRLNLPLTRKDMTFSGVQGADCQGSRHLTYLSVSSKQGNHKVAVKAAVVNKVTNDMPPQELLSASTMPHLQGLQLADPKFHIPSGIDIILGAETFPQIMLEEPPIKGDHLQPLAVATIFGRALVGPAPTKHPSPDSFQLHHTQPSVSNRELSLQMQLFWRAEEEQQSSSPLTQGEEMAEAHFTEHTTYSAQDHRYTVALPWKPDTATLGDSREQAVARFKANERSIIRRGIYSEFQAGVQNYLDLDHAEPVPPSNTLPAGHYYLPMHSVLKISSTTTKLRVVFDGSAATTTGVSLNQALLIGPTIQPSLETTLIKFRTYTVALTADISKMYREVQLHESDRDYHRFVWRSDPSLPIQDYRMKRVTFGISASPALAIRTLHQIAEDHAKHLPHIAHHLRTSFYVDDFLGGAQTPAEAIQLFHQIRAVLSKGGFNLRKWKSSSPEVMAHIPIELQDSQPTSTLIDTEKTGGNRALGLSWEHSPDTMGPHISQPECYTPTKRGIVSDVSKTFDVLGMIAPTVLQMKLLYQTLWQAGTDWDEVVSQDIQTAHQTWREQLPLLSAKQLRRCYHRVDSTPLTFTLQGFADASDTSYGAVVYIRCTYKDHPPEMSLVKAKTRVIKLKEVQSKHFTIHRKELCAAELLTQLLLSLQQDLQISPQQTYAWSDSTTVLSWIAGDPTTYKTFVANRLKKIQHITSSDSWRYVPSGDNPADSASRGISPKELLDLELWWSGPPWLLVEPPDFPPQPPRKPKAVSEQQLINCMVIQPEPPPQLEASHNNYHKLLAHTAWWLRFLQRSLHRPAITTDPVELRLQASEITNAEVWLVKRSQNRAFHKERASLLLGHPCPPSSPLHPLSIFMDGDKLIRLGGRLAHSSLSLSQKHPVILSSKDLLTIMLATYLHQCLGHCGAALLLASLSTRFYIMGARVLCLSVCKKCVTCKRVAPRPLPQYMGDLPHDRVTLSSPFTTTGMDLAGPITVKRGLPRKPQHIDTHVCIFVCFATKAVHLEAVRDQTTPAFIACFNRFVNRKGLPHTLYSDNGSNFVGAHNKLRKFYKFLDSKETQDGFNQHLLPYRVVWHHSPAKSPHFGGLWEAAVKSFKKHLTRIVGPHILAQDEFDTILCQIEGCMNSRPLLPYTSHDRDGLSPLTPGHFLIHKPLRAYPVEPSPEEPKTLACRWKMCQAISYHFWNRWHREYVATLHKRGKWTKQQENLQVDDIVVIKEDSPYLCDWPLARVLEVYPGSDGLVRVAKVKTQKSTYRRPVAKLALLHRESDRTTSLPPPGACSVTNTPGLEQPPAALPEEQKT